MTEHLFQVFCNANVSSTPTRARRRCQRFFHGVKLQNKVVIDVGGGSGFLAFYAKAMGAKKAIVLEPDLDGSESKSSSLFSAIQGGTSLEVEFLPITIQKFLESEAKYYAREDVVVLFNNSINHIFEHDVVNTAVDGVSINYSHLFKQISDSFLSCEIILADCSRTSYLNKLIGVNPLMQTIEWEKHWQPEMWAKHATFGGFIAKKINWTFPNSLPNNLNIIFDNFIVGQLTLAHFRLVLVATDN